MALTITRVRKAVCRGSRRVSNGHSADAPLERASGYFVHGLHRMKTPELAGDYRTKAEAVKAAQRAANEENEPITVSPAGGRGAMFQVYPRGSRRVSNGRQYYDFRVVSESAPRKALSHHKGSLSAQTAARKLARKYGPTRVQVATHGSEYFEDAFPGYPSFGASKSSNPMRTASRMWALQRKTGQGWDTRVVGPDRRSIEGTTRWYQDNYPPASQWRSVQLGREDQASKSSNPMRMRVWRGRAANPSRSRLYSVTVPPTASERGYQFTIRARTAGAALREARRYCARNAGMTAAGYKLPRGSSARLSQTTSNPRITRAVSIDGVTSYLPEDKISRLTFYKTYPYASEADVSLVDEVERWLKKIPRSMDLVWHTVTGTSHARIYANSKGLLGTAEQYARKSLRGESTA